MRQLRFSGLLATALVAASFVAGCGSLMHPTAVKARTALTRAFGTASGVHLFTLPEAGDGVIPAAIANAKTSVRLQMYLLTDEATINALGAAKARGVDVQVLLEPRPFIPGAAAPKDDGPRMASPNSVNGKSAAKLSSMGIQVTWTSARFTFTHAKVMTIDDQATFISTANFTKSGLSSDGEFGSREFIIEDRNPADVAEVVSIFQADLTGGPIQPNASNLVVSPDNSRAKIFALLNAAQKDITIQLETAADPQVDALLAAKLQAGVKVRALLADMGGPRSNNGTSARNWTAAGAQVRFQVKPYLHGKAIVVDGTAMYVGSENLTTNSLDLNREMGVMVTDPNAITQVSQTFERDWANGQETSKKAAPSAKKSVALPGGDVYDEPLDSTDEDAI